MEVILAFFIFVTIFIDSLSITSKGVNTVKRFPATYVVSQALTYVTRFSIFFIMPFIGYVLDGNYVFSMKLFCISLALFLIIHSVVFSYTLEFLTRKLLLIIRAFSISLPQFFLMLMALFNGVYFSKKLYTAKIHLFYIITHIFLSLTFPLMLYLGKESPELRATLMGGMALYTGVFSIYIVFFVERRISTLSKNTRVYFVRSLMYSKSVATLLSSGILFIVSI